MNQALLDRIIASPRLPSVPAVALQVIDLVQNPDVDIDHLAATIANDPALAGKILQTVNSSFYAQSRTIASIPHAIVVMGLTSVRTLALGFTLTDSLRRNTVDSTHFSHDYYWQRCILSGAAARIVAARRSAVLGEDAFVAGLLHQLGVLAMHETLGATYDETGEGAWGDGALLIQREQAAFDLDHTVVGEALAESWNLPPRIVHCIRHYADPAAAPPEFQDFTRSVQIADLIAAVFLGPEPGATLAKLRRTTAQSMQLSDDDLDRLITTVRADTDEMGTLFDLIPADVPSASEILSRANETLMEFSLQATQEASQLQARNRELSTLAALDGLTALANRRRFDEFLAQQVRIAARYRRPLSLLMIDADYLKDINDTHGHPAGDAVLQSVARVLQICTREADLVARYGGDEFAVVLPDTPMEGALVMADRARAEVEALSVHRPDGVSLKVTISIGVAAYHLDAVRGPEALLADADAGLYAAKRAGRNRVKVGHTRAA